MTVAERIKSDRVITHALDWLKRVYTSSVRGHNQHFSEMDVDHGSAAMCFEELTREAEQFPPFFPDGLEILNEQTLECNAILEKEKDNIANCFAIALSDFESHEFEEIDVPRRRWRRW